MNTWKSKAGHQMQSLKNFNKVSVAAMLKNGSHLKVNFLEINVDCAFNGENGKAAISMGIRDRMRILIDGVFQICDATSILMGFVKPYFQFCC